MCRSANDPGGPRRCDHLTSTFRSLEKRATVSATEKQQLSDARKVYLASHPDAKAKKKREALEQEAIHTEGWAKRFRRVGTRAPKEMTEEQRDAWEEKQAARQEAVNQASSIPVRVKLTGGEVAAFREEAEQEGVEVADLVRARLREPLPFEDKGAREVQGRASYTHSDRGRPPSKNGTKRDAPLDVRLSRQETVAVEDTANQLGMTASDLLRAIVTKKDPRISWGHLSAAENGSGTRRTAMFEQREAAAVAAGESPLTAYEKVGTDKWLVAFAEERDSAAEASVADWVAVTDKATVEPAVDAEQERQAA